MKKIFVLALVALFVATSAYAVDFETSGMYEAVGTWISNPTGLQSGNEGDPTVDYGYYDHELDMTTRIVVDDATKVIVNYEIRDESWITGNTDGTKQDGSSGLDDNIEFKRVFGSHTFASTGTSVDVGLMTGGTWAYDWADNANGRYRVKVTQATPIGPVIGILEKNAELGSINPGVEDAEKDDYDAYALASVFKAGPVNIKPLLYYLDNSAAIQDRDTDGVQTFLVDLGIDGSYENWGFENEWQWRTVDSDLEGGTEPSYWGVFLNAWFLAGPAKIYGHFAYGSEDEGAYMGFGDDYEPLHYLGYQTGFGGSRANDLEIANSFVYLLGINYAATDDLSFSAAAAYLDSDAGDDTGGDGFWKDASAWEFDLGMAYKISDAVVYDVGFGYADIDLEERYAGQSDPDGAWRLYHRLKISF